MDLLLFIQRYDDDMLFLARHDKSGYCSVRFGFHVGCTDFRHRFLPRCLNPRRHESFLAWGTRRGRAGMGDLSWRMNRRMEQNEEGGWR